MQYDRRMKIRLGMLMDPIGSIKIRKDSSFAMLLAAQRRGWDLFYLELWDIGLRDGRPWGRMRRLEVADQTPGWFRFLTEPLSQPLESLDLILMRKDPPVDMEYLYATLILEQAERLGCRVVNAPRALRDANEKLYALEFPDCCPPSLVTAQAADIKQFLDQQGDIILKPLGAMGGTAVFRVRTGDPNLNVIIETLTDRGQRHLMAQSFIPEIQAGDKRILVIDGQPVPYALARIPAPGETRGNLAAGGSGHPQALSDRDWEIARRVAPSLQERGVLFAGLDVIGDYLTEINITSPTCIRELDQAFGLDIAGQLLDLLEGKLNS